MPAIRYMKTAVDTEGSWDGPANETRIPSDAKEAQLRKFYAWADPSKDPDTKAAYKFGHHNVDANGKIGAANMKACSSGIAVLNGGRGGAKIPDADRQGVYNHLAAHMRDAKADVPALNSLSADKNMGVKYKRHQVGVLIEKNAFVDEGDGLISFPNKLVVSDNTEQRNGTRYDVDTLDLSEYKGQLTADHVDMLGSIIGKVGGVAKVGTQIVIDSIRFAVKENPLARLAYNLLKGGYLTDFSIETYDGYLDEEDVYRDAKMMGLSAVVVGNNRNATINTIVTNSLKQAKEDGLDTTKLEESLLTTFNIKQVHLTPDIAGTTATVSETDNLNSSTNHSSIAITDNSAIDDVSRKNTATNEETDMSKTMTVDGTKVTDVKEEKVENKIEDKETKMVQVAPVVDMNALAELLEKKLEEKLRPIQEKVEAVEQNAFDKKAKEPEFKKDENGAHQDGLRHSKNDFASLPWQERHAKQINAAWDLLKRHDTSAFEVLNKINEVNLNDLKKEGRVSNALTIADFGNFVISRELLTEIEGCRNNYTGLVNATQWKETLSTQFAWLKRSGDINMQSVEFCDDGANGNRKPISEYTATIQTSDLEELAAVTPVCNAATRFLAADLLGDVAAGYRNDYDRKRAQLVVARLEQAIETNGNSVIYDTNPAVNALTDWVDVWSQIATCTPNGTFVFNTSTLAEVMRRAVESGTNGPLANIFINGANGMPTLWGRPYIVVPDDIMPTLNAAGTVAIAVDGTTVTVNHAVFYADLANFTGRTSGGLQYDLSTDAAYEESGTVKSAYQRNELVLRGSFFRGGAIKDTDQVAGLLSPGVS